jgi:hypothetical protein
MRRVGEWATKTKIGLPRVMEITMHRYASQPVMNFEDYLKNTLHTKKPSCRKFPQEDE